MIVRDSPKKKTHRQIVAANQRRRLPPLVGSDVERARYANAGVQRAWLHQLYSQPRYKGEPDSTYKARRGYDRAMRLNERQAAGLVDVPLWAGWGSKTSKAIKNLPHGVQRTVEAPLLDLYDLGRHPMSKHHYRRTSGILKDMGVGIKEDVRHPIRNLPFLAMDLLGFASGGTSTAARGTALLGKLGEGAGLRASLKAARDVTYVPQPRIYTRPGAVVYQKGDMPHSVQGHLFGTHEEQVLRGGKLVPRHVEDLQGYSRDPFVRGVQKLRDQRIHAALKRAPIPSGAYDRLMHPERRLRNLEEQSKHVQREIDLGRGQVTALPGADNRSIPGMALDSTNATASLLKVLARPAYLPTNLGNNAWLDLAHHSYSPRALSRSTSNLIGLHRIASAKGSNAIDVLNHVTGQGSERSLALDVGPAAERTWRGKVIVGGMNVPMQATRAVGDIYQKIIDRQPRALAVAREAERLGYNTPEKLHDLLTKPGHNEDLLRVAVRARNNMVDFSTPKKWHKAARRAIFVFPWVRGATRFGGHFVKEHPLQSSLFLQAGQAEKRRQDAGILGPRVSFEEGIFPTGSFRNVPGVGKVPMIRNEGSISPFGTPADVATAFSQAILGSPKGFEAHSEGAPGLRDFFNPLGDAGLSSITGVTSSGHDLRGFSSSLPANLLANLERSPSIDLIQALRHKGQFAPGYDKSSLMFPRTPWDEARKFGWGTLSAQPYNPKQGREKLRSEISRQLNPMEKAQYRHQWRTEDTTAEMRRLGLIKKGEGLPKELEFALHLQEARAYSRAKMRARVRNPNALDLVSADMKVLVADKLLPDRVANSVEAAVAKALKLHPDQGKLILKLVSHRLSPLFQQHTITLYQKLIKSKGGDDGVLSAS